MAAIFIRTAIFLSLDNKTSELTDGKAIRRNLCKVCNDFLVYSIMDYA